MTGRRRFHRLIFYEGTTPLTVNVHPSSVEDYLGRAECLSGERLRGIPRLRVFSLHPHMGYLYFASAVGDCPGRDVPYLNNPAFSSALFLALTSSEGRHLCYDIHFEDQIASFFPFLKSGVICSLVLPAVLTGIIRHIFLFLTKLPLVLLPSV